VLCDHTGAALLARLTLETNPHASMSANPASVIVSATRCETQLIALLKRLALQL